MTLFYQTTCSADYSPYRETAASTVVAIVPTCLKLDSTHFNINILQEIYSYPQYLKATPEKLSISLQMCITLVVHSTSKF